MPGLTDRIDDVLPQTQCQRCGYPRCQDYARAIAGEDAPINRCPPGGDETVAALAELTGKRIVALDPACGEFHHRLLLRIDEARCIGCTLCIQACPVDAVIGSGKLMHTIIANECTGCELCLPACPVDCIKVEHYPYPDTFQPGLWKFFSRSQAKRARKRVQARLARTTNQPAPTQQEESNAIRDEIAAAVARVRNKRGRAT